ncbi:MAG: four helix bundle protein [Roseivirga sp.]|nr:four helix bundle protein [Roseivirga sp.]
MRNFKKLPVWQKGMDIVTMTYQLSDSLTELLKYRLIDQLQQAAVSIPSNIAIGSSHENDNDYRAFLKVSLGACFQLETLLLVIGKLPFETGDMLKQLFEAVEEEKRLLMDFMRQLILRGA